MIPMEKCKHNYLYIISARNSNLGIYISYLSGFVIRRIKFGEAYLFVEHHWELDENFGTVKPQTEVEKAPMNIDEWQSIDMYNKEIMSYLQKAEEQLRSRTTDREV